MSSDRGAQSKPYIAVRVPGIHGGALITVSRTAFVALSRATGASASSSDGLISTARGDIGPDVECVQRTNNDRQ